MQLMNVKEWNGCPVQEPIAQNRQERWALKAAVSIHMLLPTTGDGQGMTDSLKDGPTCCLYKGQEKESKGNYIPAKQSVLYTDAIYR